MRWDSYEPDTLDINHHRRIRLKQIYARESMKIISAISECTEKIFLSDTVTLENEHVRQEKHRLEDRKVLDEFG